MRVGVDGAPWTGVDLVPPLAAAVERRGRKVLVVDVADFLRPASVRLERGRDDPDAFYEDWVDVAGLRREVLEPLGPGGPGPPRLWLPALWDAERDRSFRRDYEVAPDDAVLLVRGRFLLAARSGTALPFDLTVHLALSPAARRRRVPAADAARELPAYQRYDDEAAPAEIADVVVRCDDPRHLAVIDRT